MYGFEDGLHGGKRSADVAFNNAVFLVWDNLKIM